MLPPPPEPAIVVTTALGDILRIRLNALSVT